MLFKIFRANAQVASTHDEDEAIEQAEPGSTTVVHDQDEDRVDVYSTERDGTWRKLNAD